ncbi:hypothetical protein ES703_119792 [subsurface metagenome]
MKISIQKRFYSVREAANYTSLSSRLIYQKLKNRAIKSYRVGTKIVLDRQDLDTFVMSNAVMTSDELRKILKEKTNGKRRKAGS